MGRLFGTDGIRGVVNENLNAELAFEVGCAAAQVLGKDTGKKRPLVAIGKDTRISSDLLEGALIAGLCSAGADVLHLGVTPTPAVAFLTTENEADAGIVISASHNSFEHNGIKIFNGQGFKLSDKLENEIEDMILFHESPALCAGAEVGRVIYADKTAAARYVEHLADTVEGDLSGLHILVDCANGAASATAAALFRHFPGLRVDIIHDQPNGININYNCGSTHIEKLASQVREGGYDLGIAFDGDADRCLAADELGNEIDGDQILAVCAAALQDRKMLPSDTIVGTVMSNLGLHYFAKERGIHLICTDVGDRHVLEKMEEGGFLLGGEQSGHTIFRRYATTGDGELTALQLMAVLKQSGQPASKLAAICKRYPQVLINVPVSRDRKEELMTSSVLAEAIAAEERALEGCGRILVRPSGTEPLIRVMVEAREQHIARTIGEKLANIIKKL